MTNGSTIGCVHSAAYQSIYDALSYFTYTIMPLVCFLVGFPSQVLGLAAYVKNRNKETAYPYQILVSIGRIVEIVAGFLVALCFFYGAGRNWGLQPSGSGLPWFKRSYPLMWLAATFSAALSDTGQSVTVLTSLAMTADRVFGLWKPIVYRSANHKRILTVASIICFLVPILAAAYLCFTYEPVLREGAYDIQFTDFSVTPMSGLLWQLDSGVRSAGVLVMIILSIAMCYLFRKSNRKAMKMISQDKAQEARRKAVEKSLFKMAIVQSVAASLPSSMLLATQLVLIFASHSFLVCDWNIVYVVMNCLHKITDTADFFLMLLANGRFRRMVVDTLKSNQATAAVSPAINVMPAP